MLITRGNMKLGLLPSFSLPPLKTCPGKTPFCDKYCFGQYGRYAFGNVTDANEERWELSKSKDFALLMTIEIRRLMSPAFRVHVVGDFYSAEYTEKWLKIVRKIPEISFFGSTRSWRVPNIAPVLEELRDQPNVCLRASTDFTDTLTPGPAWATWSVEGAGEPCPHDKHRVKSCYTCGRCWSDKNISTMFRLRWAEPGEYTSIPLLEHYGKRSPGLQT